MSSAYVAALKILTSLSSMNWWRRITVLNMRKEKFETSIIVGILRACLFVLNKILVNL